MTPALHLIQKIKSLRLANQNLLITLFLLVGILLFWGIFSFIRLGTISSQSFIARIGTPLLGWQVLIAAAVGLGFLVLLPDLSPISTSSRKSIRIEIGICLIIWLTAASLWLSAPIEKTYNIRQPVAPNYEFYPYSDAANYTAGAQSLLIGEGYPRQMIDKPVYMAYLTVLNLLAGQSFNRVIDLQVILLSFIPVMLYLIGKSLHNRSAGIIVAILSIFKQLNVLATTPLIFHVASYKVMTVEPFTGLILVLFLFFFLSWLKHPAEKQIYPILAGGFLGIASLVRLTPLVLLPLSILVAWSVAGWRIRPLLRPVGLFLLIFVLSLLPWMAFNQVTFGNPFTFINRKTISVVVEHRYSNYIEEEQPATEPSVPVLMPTSSPQPTAASGEISPSEPSPQVIELPSLKKYLTLTAYILDRFVINSLTNIFVLPPKMFSDTRTSIFDHYYWRYNIRDNLDIESAVSLLVNFLLIALGIASAWTRYKIIGLLPLGLNLGYNFGNALTLSAAGFRSVVPVDWTGGIYFAIGLSTILYAVMKKRNPPTEIPVANPAIAARNRVQRVSVILVSLAFLLIGSISVLITVAVQPRFPFEDEQKVLARLEAQNSIAKHLPSSAVLQSFISQQATAFAIRSRAMFPRYYLPGQGDNTEESGLLDTKPYPQLSFVLVSPDLSEVLPLYSDPEQAPTLVNVNMPLAEAPDVFPNAADVSVIGCFDHLTGQINGLAVIVHGSQERVYLRSPLPDHFVCDIPQPICESNICR